MSTQWMWTSLYLVTLCLLVETFAQLDCDKVFSSYQTDKKTGVFQSPGFPSHYPNNVQCKFKFIGRKGKEHVKIQFTDFDLQGRRPACINDYVTIYSQIGEEKNSDNLLGAKGTGPFCGEGLSGLPSMLLSTKHILVIYFYSNNQKTNNGFRGTYEFVEEVPHGMSTVSPDVCGYMVSSSKKSRGSILSPSYPGVYPDSHFCSYSLKGRPGERIKLTFEEFSLFYGGEYCPFDYLTIYDGSTKYDYLIGKFCGSYNRSTVIYSTTEFLRLEFTSGKDRLDFNAPSQSRQGNADFATERRGFNITFEFSNKFVKLDHHYLKDGNHHIRGTECDLRIMSSKESDGTFVSPSYPQNFPEDIVCRFYLDGLMDEQNLEKVKVSFYDFNIPGNMPYCLLGYLAEHEDGRLGSGSVNQKYCGQINPPKITSKGPRLVLTLNTTGARNGGKFVARYKFITNYDINGEEIEEGKCKFHYHKTKEGFINSPRHPRIYPVNTDCEYIFRPEDNEVVMLSFVHFELSDMKNPFCDIEDYVAFYEDVGPPGKSNFTLTEKFCGQISPGPYVTSRLLKMVFHSNQVKGFVGFKAEYKFVPRTDMDRIGACFAHIDARGTGGVIMSPKYPASYPALIRCEWIITASLLQNRILVELSDLNIEGSYGKNGAKSTCFKVAVRLYNDSMMLSPMDLVCGKKMDTDGDRSYMSLHDSFKIVFVSSPSSLGATGFKISWTEIHTGASSMDCTGFQCTKNKYCIAPSLKCNKEPNCGQGDNSDETAECAAPRVTFYVFLLLVTTVYISLFHINL